MKPPRKNIAESARARLLSLSKQRGEEFHLTLAEYAVERFLYRLGQSPLRDRFVLKGAVLFRVWMGQVHRPTKDLDLLGKGSSTYTAPTGLVVNNEPGDIALCHRYGRAQLRFAVETVKA